MKSRVISAELSNIEAAPVRFQLCCHIAASRDENTYSFICKPNDTVITNMNLPKLELKQKWCCSGCEGGGGVEGMRLGEVAPSTAVGSISALGEGKGVDSSDACRLYMTAVTVRVFHSPIFTIWGGRIIYSFSPRSSQLKVVLLWPNV